MGIVLEKLDLVMQSLNETPILSISCITYNHSPYIEQCLVGMLMQKTTFKFEIIIHDDASTDGTADIIKRYQEIYPNIIFPIFQNENQWSKGLSPTWDFNVKRCRGKYIALCEGDDYWTDPLKLQKQYEVAVKDDLIFIGHFVSVFDQQSNKIIKNYEFHKNIIELKDAIFGPPVHTSSFFFKNILSNIKFDKNLPSGDDFLACELLSRGKGYVINEIMSVYRISNAGSWSTLSQSRKDEKSIKIQLWILQKYKLRILAQLNRIGNLYYSASKENKHILDSYKFNNVILICIGIVISKLINKLKWLKGYLKINYN